MSMKVSINNLLGKDLKHFKVVEMTEVYRTNEDGRKSKSLGYFRERNTAQVFAGAQADAIHKTGTAYVLTDGKIGFVISEPISVRLFDDEAEAAELRNKALAKLTPLERKLLGYGS